MDIIQKLKNYFNAQIVGSYIFVENGLLSIDDINDIDVNVKGDAENNVRRFLEDEGYNETSKPHQYRGYEQVPGSLMFSKEGKKLIHVLLQNDLKVYSISELIAKKYERNQKSDLEQLQKVIEYKIKSSNEK